MRSWFHRNSPVRPPVGYFMDPSSLHIGIKIRFSARSFPRACSQQLEHEWLWQNWSLIM